MTKDNKKFTFQDFEKSVKRIFFKPDKRYKDALRQTMILKHRTIYGQVTTKEKAEYYLDMFFNIFRFRTVKQGIMVASFAILFLVGSTMVLHPQVRGAVQKTAAGVSKCGVDFTCISDIEPMSQEIDLAVNILEESDVLKVDALDDKGKYDMDFGLSVKNEGPDAADFVVLDLEILGAFDNETLNLRNTKNCNHENEGEDAKKLSCEVELGTLKDNRVENVRFNLNFSKAKVIKVKASVKTDNKYLEDINDENNSVVREFIIEGIDPGTEIGGIDITVRDEEEMLELNEKEDVDYKKEYTIKNNSSEKYEGIRIESILGGKVTSDSIKTISKNDLELECKEAGENKTICLSKEFDLEKGEEISILVEAKVLEEGSINNEIRVLTNRFNDSNYVLVSKKVITEVVNRSDMNKDVSLKLEKISELESLIEKDGKFLTQIQYTYQYSNQGLEESTDTNVRVDFGGFIADDSILIKYSENREKKCELMGGNEGYKNGNCLIEIGKVGAGETGELSYSVVYKKDTEIFNIISITRQIKNVDVVVGVISEADVDMNVSKTGEGYKVSLFNGGSSIENARFELNIFGIFDHEEIMADSPQQFLGCEKSDKWQSVCSFEVSGFEGGQEKNFNINIEGANNVILSGALEVEEYEMMVEKYLGADTF